MSWPPCSHGLPSGKCHECLKWQLREVEAHLDREGARLGVVIPPLGSLCEHGQLARSCDHCDANQALVSMETTVRELRAALTRETARADKAEREVERLRDALMQIYDTDVGRDDLDPDGGPGGYNAWVEARRIAREALR